MAVPGISTVGVLFGYGTGATKPSAFELLTRINSIGEINLSAETINASALEDEVEKSIQGRLSTGGNVDVVVNLTDDTLTEWEKVITDFKALSSGEQMYFTVYYPGLAKATYFIAEPPKKIGQPSVDQNGLATATMSLTINEYLGWDTKIKPAKTA